MVDVNADQYSMDTMHTVWFTKIMHFNWEKINITTTGKKDNYNALFQNPIFQQSAFLFSSSFPSRRVETVKIIIIQYKFISISAKYNAFIYNTKQYDMSS